MSSDPQPLPRPQPRRAIHSQVDARLAKWLQPKTNTTDKDKQSECKERVENGAGCAAATSAATIAAASSDSAALAVLPSAVSPHASLSDFLSSITRDLNVLHDASRSGAQRKAAIERLQARMIVSGIESMTQPAPSHLIQAHRQALKPLLKRFADPLETCRFGAIKLIHAAVQTLPDLPSYLPYIVPVLAYRMGTIDLANAPVTLGSNTAMHERENPEATMNRPQDDPDAAATKPSLPDSAERAEPVRAELLSLLHSILVRCSGADLDSFLPDICQILYTSLQTDSSPECKILACDCLTILGEDYTQPMRAFSRILILPLMQRALLHHLARVRIAAIKALGALIPCGAAELLRDLAAFREHNVIDIHAFYHGESRTHFLARMVEDPNPKVRVQFYKVLNGWSTSLYERADYETLIMPYVFTGLSDTHEPIRQMAMETMEVLGREFEKDEKERLANGVGGNAMDEGAFRIKFLAEEQSREHLSKLPILLFEPFTSRPGWGQRQIARKFLDRLLHAILTELLDWKSGVAERSWSLLRVLLVYAEEHATQYAPKILTACIQAIQHASNKKEQPIQTMWDCAALVGRYAQPHSVVDTLVSHVSRAESGAAGADSGERLRATLRVAAHLLPFMPHTHPDFTAALTTFVRGVLCNEGDTGDEGNNSTSTSSPDRTYLTLEVSTFQSYVGVIAALLNMEGLSHAFMHAHASTFFRILLEISAWSRIRISGMVGLNVIDDGSVHNGNGMTGSNHSNRAAHADLHKTIDRCYLSLLHRIDESEDDLLLVFQLHLLPLVQSWISHARSNGGGSMSISSSSERTMEVGMMAEVLRKVGSKGLFVPIPNELQTILIETVEQWAKGNNQQTEDATPYPAALSALNPTQQISVHFQSLILALLQLNTNLAVHAIIQPVLASSLRAPADLSTFSSSWLCALLTTSLHRLQSFAHSHASDLASYTASIPSAASLTRLSREEELRVAALEKTRDMKVRRFDAYSTAVVECMQAAAKRMDQHVGDSSAAISSATPMPLSPDLQRLCVTLGSIQPSSLATRVIAAYSQLCSARGVNFDPIPDSDTMDMLTQLKSQLQMGQEPHQTAVFQLLTTLVQKGRFTEQQLMTTDLSDVLRRTTSTSSSDALQTAARDLLGALPKTTG